MPELKPRAILFDVGNVLIRLRTQDFLDSLQKACPALSAERMLAELRLEGPHHAYERGEIDGPAFHAHLQKNYGLSWDYAEWLRHWNDYFLPNRPMEAFIAKLKAQVKFWALSNTNAEHYTHFKREFRLFDGFAEVFASHQYGLRKPDPRLYALALDKMGLPAREVLFIDDMDYNVEAAKAAGMIGFHYTFNDLELKAFCRGLGLEFPDGETSRSIMAC